MIYDFIVVGAGIAGASAAYELAEHSKVLILESESQPGYHSTGRSAALFTPNFGNRMVCSINKISELFFNNPPAHFIDSPLLKPRGALSVAAHGQDTELDQLLSLSTPSHLIEEITAVDALSIAPFLRADRVGRAVLEKGVSDIDVATLLHAYVKGFKNRGGELIGNEAVESLSYKNGSWLVSTRNHTYQAQTIINAAGAWADQVGALAGAASIGLVPKRRTVITFDATTGYSLGDLPLVEFARSGVYMKPESGKLIASLADATPTSPQDVQPEELDVAVLADQIQQETLIPVNRILHRWAGLRSFVKDESPVVGFDHLVPNFVWLAGQGGYGIMMAPTLARAVAQLCLSGSLPKDMLSAGISIDDLDAKRLSEPTV